MNNSRVLLDIGLLTLEIEKKQNEIRALNAQIVQITLNAIKALPQSDSPKLLSFSTGNKKAD